jgi:hypothetical protein
MYNCGTSGEDVFISSFKLKRARKPLKREILIEFKKVNKFK